ncbi:methylmalonyl Co-A mutase-associated GTPase MeaB [bacterium]|nr:MAG: methylmalonyl Co-A mutase-associated GTPase MeaB [bacterium]
MRRNSPLDVVEGIKRGDRRALARAISVAEGGGAAPLISALFKETGRAFTVGITGPPGVGKSTLTGALVTRARKEGKSVGLILVDPSSPFSQGALLGDRIRLSDHFTDPDVFIRSMASRGHLGGIAGATGDAVMLMDAFGKDMVIVETVGVGQSEIEIAEVADTTVVCLQPGSGDSIQVLKAGIMEIADVFVVNKADHPMAGQLRREIRIMMTMLDWQGWAPALVMTQATTGEGTGQLWDALWGHRAYLQESGELRSKRASAFAHEVRNLILGRLAGAVDGAMAGAVVSGLMERVADRAVDPYAAAEQILQHFDPKAATAPGARLSPRVRATVKGLHAPSQAEIAHHREAGV